MSKKYINVVATVDLTDGSGEILYVNPVRPEGGMDASVFFARGSSNATSRAIADESGAIPSAANFELCFYDAKGAELKRIQPDIGVSQCAVQRIDDVETDSEVPMATATPRSGIINAFVPYLEGMKAVALLYHDKEISRFQGGVAVATSAGKGLAFGEAADGAPHRRSMRPAEVTVPDPGVTFTVQVKPEGKEAWQTIAVGRERPDAQFDRNQFPGAKSARVRILRTTGFDDEVFLEEDVKLEF